MSEPHVLESDEPLRLGIIADKTEHIGALSSLLSYTHHRITSALLIDDYSLPLTGDIDAWVIRVEHAGERVDVLIDWLTDSDIPVVFDDVDEQRSCNDPSVAKSLSDKLHACIAANRDMDVHSPLPEKVWVLAGSAGGPEAVFAFLAGLGRQASKNAYLYVQHMNVQTLSVLMTSLRAHAGELRIEECADGVVIEAGVLYVVSPEREFDIQAGRRFIETHRAWKGDYQPSIDQVVSKVARAFKAKSSVIVFSGMCNDGSGSVRLIHAAGGKVLVQDFDECAVDSMPREVSKTGCVDFSGTAHELARYVDTEQHKISA